MHVTELYFLNQILAKCTNLILNWTEYAVITNIVNPGLHKEPTYIVAIYNIWNFDGNIVLYNFGIYICCWISSGTYILCILYVPATESINGDTLILYSPFLPGAIIGWRIRMKLAGKLTGG